MSLKFPILVFIVMQFCSPILYSQEVVSGVIFNENDSLLSGVSIVAKDALVGTISNDSGYFEIEVPEYANTLLFSFFGYESQQISIDSIDHDDFVLKLYRNTDFEEQFVICPQPPQYSLGLFSFLSNYPYGASAEVAGWAAKNRAILNISSDLQTNSFMKLEYYPNIRILNRNYDYINPKIRVQSIIAEDSLIFSGIIENSIIFGNSGLKIKPGIGYVNSLGDSYLLFNIGISKFAYIQYFDAFPRGIVTNLSFDIDITPLYTDWSFQTEFEAISKSYNGLNFSIGYGTCFGVEGLRLSIRYKRFIIDREDNVLNRTTANTR